VLPFLIDNAYAQIALLDPPDSGKITAYIVNSRV